MTRPLRSVLIGDIDYYPSEFAFGVNQAMTRAGHWHSTVNIRWDMGVIMARVLQVQPDIIWGHMLLWPPGDRPEPGQVMSAKAADLLDLCVDWRQRGASVLIHDGDARDETRCPIDISPAVSAALCNHHADRSAWNVTQVRWPYFAFDQERIADPMPEFTCDLAFAGRLDEGPLYAERTQLVRELKAKLGSRMKVFPNTDMLHTLFRTPELAVSAGAILGYGRPEKNGWVDVRTFQYPGAGGILLSNDVDEFLHDGIHYLKYEGTSAESVLNTLHQLWSSDSPSGMMRHSRAHKLRHDAFQYVQERHSATVRVREALAVVGRTL